MRKTIALGALLALGIPGVAQASDKSVKRSAKQECRAERQADAAAFKAKYGTNENKRNAMGKCVSAKVKAAKAERRAAKQACKAERKADPAAFRAKYGTNPNRRNAMGKCVSAKAKASGGEVEGADDDKAGKKDDKAGKKDDEACDEAADRGRSDDADKPGKGPGDRDED